MSFINNQTQSSNYQNRSEFIEKFQQQHSNVSSNRNINSSNPNARWNYLHDLNRLKQVKLEEKREKQRIIEQEKSFSECTFTPKLNKSVNYCIPNSSRYPLMNQNNSSFNGVNLCTDSSINLINRQEAWNQKKNTKIETLRQYQSNKEIEQCYFYPSINKESSLNKSHIKSNAVSLLEDPESYTMYVKRLAKKREEDEFKKKRENSLPGSGKVWTSKPKNYNLSYDYTKHEITDKCLPRAKSNNKIGTSRSKSNTKKKIEKNMDKDKFFDYLYQNKTSTNNTCSNCGNEKKNDNYHTNYSKNIEQNSNHLTKILLDQPIEYGKALEILHKELFDFPLLDDE